MTPNVKWSLNECAESLNDGQKFPPLSKNQHDSCLNIFKLIELASSVDCVKIMS